MLEKIQKTSNFLLEKIGEKPEVGIILGTGLNGLSEEIKIEKTFKYSDIPNFPISTVKGHKGQLIFGKIGDKNVVAMQGRFHYYEGYSMEEVTFPIRVMKFLGIDLLILSNASGGLNEVFDIGDIMIITDQINLMPENPLRGLNDERLGPRFPDMSEIYTKKHINSAKKIARHHKIKYQTGVFAAVSGPTYETPAEYTYIKTIGADAVGMSTVPEAIVARHMGIEVFAISLITDLGVAGKIVEISHEEVLEAAAQAEPKARIIIKELIQNI
ncbi:MAG: purine-nucleoside phosphorylase [Bacteroidota bacterium]|nr:purine-nucleoside phosphorylase [Bacteroidota bacterium]